MVFYREVCAVLLRNDSPQYWDGDATKPLAIFRSGTRPITGRVDRTYCRGFALPQSRMGVLLRMAEVLFTMVVDSGVIISLRT